MQKMHIIERHCLCPSRIILSPDFSGMIGSWHEEDDILLQTIRITKDDVDSIVDYAKKKKIVFEPEYSGAPLNCGDLIVVSNEEKKTYLMSKFIPKPIASVATI